MRAFAVKQQSHRHAAPAKWTISDGVQSVQRDAVNPHDLSRTPIVAQTPAETQPELAANTPGHVSEHEADLIADQEPASSASRPDTGQQFGHDFSRVSVHAEATSRPELLHHARNALMGSLGERAGRIPIETASTKTKNAEGLTVDRRVHLAPGRFDTQSYEGRVRLGHEVAHAIQQERGAGLSSALAPAHRTALEMESEEAGRAFAGGRRFSVIGKAPTTVPLFRGPGEEEEPEAERELDAAFQRVLDKQAARGAAIERYRKERKDYISAHLEYREYDVPVDARLRKMPAGQQQQELWMRVLQMEFPSIAREDAEEILRRTGMKTWSVESDTVAEQIRKRDKIHFRTKFMRLLVEVYNEIVEDRVRASLNVDELLNPGPDMALEIFKDVGRGYYNGILGFAQGLVDLPAAPVNLIQSLRGGEQKHILDLSGLRADYHTSYGIHYGSSIELGTQLGLMVVSGKLPVGAGAGTGAAASTASQASRAMRLFAIWSKLNAVSAGATAVVQAGQAIRDIARGYVIEDGKKRPLTEDDILGRLAGIAFGLHAAKSALQGAPEKPGSASSTPAPDVTDVTIERATSSKIQVSVPGEPGKIVIDATWRVLGPDGQVLGQGSPDQGALLGSKVGEAQMAQHAPPSPDTSSRQTAQTPPPATTLSALPGGGQYSGKPRGLAFDVDQPSRSVRVDTSHPIFKNRQAANEQDVPPSPQAKAMQVRVPPAREAVDMPKAQAVPGASPTGDTVEPAHMGPKLPPSSTEVGSVSSDVQTSPGGKPEPGPALPPGSATETPSSSSELAKPPGPKNPIWVRFPDGTFREFDAAEVKGALKPGTNVQTPDGAAQVVGTTGEYMQRGGKVAKPPGPKNPVWVQFPDGTVREFNAAEVEALKHPTDVQTPDGKGRVVGRDEPPTGRGVRHYRTPPLMTADELNDAIPQSRSAKGKSEPRRLETIERDTANEVLNALRDVNSGYAEEMERVTGLRPHEWTSGEFKGWWSVDLYPGNPGGLSTMRIYFRQGKDGLFEAIIRQAH